MVTSKTKKKVIKKPSVKKEVVIVEPKEIKKEYTPVFPTIKIKIKTRNELNYISIGRKLRAIFYKKKESYHEIIKDLNTPKYLKKSSTFFNFNWRFYLDTAWSEYCNWFNSIFNKEVKE